MTFDLLAEDYQQRVLATRGLVGSALEAEAPTPVRAPVWESWQRCMQFPESHFDEPDIFFTDDELRDHQQTHPLASVWPLIQSLLVEPTTQAGMITAVGSADGHLLWVDGDRAALRKAEVMGFIPGSNWSESSMGTSAPALALQSGQGISIAGAEHFAPVVHPWSCSAAPLHHPVTGEILGVLDITGTKDAASHMAMGLLKAAAHSIEAHWVNELRAAPPAPAQPTVIPLGTGAAPPTTSSQLASSGSAQDAPIRVTGYLPGRIGRHELTLRHAEILTLLDWHGHGIDGQRLSELLYGETAAQTSVTLRAEIHRLRRTLASRSSAQLLSRPYRLSQERATDASQAMAALDSGNLDTALRLASGPLLPESEAPGVVKIRTQLDIALREAVLSDANPDQLWTFLSRPEAAEDEQLWRLALQVLPADSPRRALAVATLEQLETTA